MREDTRRWIELDQQHCWHPFTRQGDWCAEANEPLVIVRGEGSWLWDSEGRRYLDGNSSIWTNIHGHSHPHIRMAIQAQLNRVAHTSFLGYTHPLAAELAARLCGYFPEETLERVFFSDNGSTAVECALRMALQYREQTGESQRTRFVAFSDGYHGDTLGAASIGGGRFSERVKNLGFPVHHAATLEHLPKDSGSVAAVIIEPAIQGVNEMRPWPAGTLAALRRWCDEAGVHLILDEVMTGFGRTGMMFACQHEGVVPDFLCLAKGLTGGSMPLAATLTTRTIYEAFLGAPENAFAYGHSYTANPLGCAAAMASLDIFDLEKTLEQLPGKIAHLHDRLAALKDQHALVHEIRQCGFIAGIEVRRPGGEKFPSQDRVGETICLAARAHGLLTRPILDTIVLMPPLSSSASEIDHAVDALSRSLSEI